MPATLPRVSTYRCYSCGRLCDTISDPAHDGPDHYGLFCPTCFTRDLFVCANCHHTEYANSACRSTVNGVDSRICRRCHREQSTWVSESFAPAENTYKKIRSRRKFGLELETSSCPDYLTMRGQTLFGVKHDCSVSGLEFFSPILHGDAGLVEVENFCAQAEQRHFAVDSDCGYHLHLDMRNETVPALKAIAYAYLKSDSAWRLLVDSFRANDCGYCRRPEYTRGQLEAASSMTRFGDAQDRYTLCNLNAYSKFGSYEIRLHQGSVNAKEICNWIKAHLRFVDWAKDKTFDEIDDAFCGSDANKWESLKAIFGDIDLNRTYGRIRRTRLGITPRARATA